MPPNSEIEKLERRWKENPKGTVFAPYAEVLRKHGDHDLAREVLRQGLELHPDHIPGNIVLGRCCLDLREDGPAEAAFTHVLDLDQENVIALKALADITERQGRLMEANSWLSRLMSVDPSNDEAKDQLDRVNAAREAAAAVMTAPLTAVPSTEATETVEILARPSAREAAPAVEVSSGSVGEEGPEVSVDDALDAAMNRFVTPPASPAMPAREDLERTVPTFRRLSRDEVDTVPVLPLIPREPAKIHELEPVEFDAGAAAAELPVEEMAGLEMDEPFAPPAPMEASPEVFSFGVEEAPAIEIQPAGASEFQAPDASADLLDLAVGESEFQVPDASAELGRLSGSGSSEYQTPSGSEALLAGLDDTLEPEAPGMAAAFPETTPIAPGGMITTGFAAISLMPTVELPTDLPPEIPAAASLPFIPPEPETGARSVVDELAAAAGLPEAPPFEPEPLWDEEPGATVAAADSGSIEDDEPPAPLKLIFPEEASEPEPPRVRRISEEVRHQPEPVPAPEPVAEAPEPEPVVTESMAELYARQGHVAEAINVYQTLLAQQPNDPRLLGRLRALEQQRAAGSRRLSYVAMDTGGESVESFFKSLAGARPAGSDAPPVEDDGSGAPTRPARDPLSLSAIFGEEPAAAQRSPEAAPRTGTPDAFSFDQFFGGNPGGATATGPRAAMPSDEDLDQFQHWLKSLKK